MCNPGEDSPQLLQETPQQADASQAPPRPGGRKGIWAWLSVIGIALCKFKALFVFLKLGKFMVTFGSMLLMVVVYATQLGWWYAVGFVLLIMVHETGHLLAAQRMGIKTSMPLFIPFVGAFISLKEHPANAKAEAIMAAGGPVLGSIGALLCLAIGIAWRSDLFLALAYTGCLINLFNLIPVHPLDGGRIVKAISPYMWLLGIPILAVVSVKFFNPIIVLFVILGSIEAFKTWRTKDTEYFNVSARTRMAFAAMFFGLMAVLGAAMAYVHAIHAGMRNQ